MNRVPLGAGALLRFAALPLAAQERGGSPDLFDQLHRLDTDSGQYRDLAAGLAEDLGRILVPLPALSRSERTQILCLRRVLHQGLEPSSEALAQVSDIIAGEARFADLAIRLSDLARRAAALRDAEREAARAVSAEYHRQLDVPWQVLRHHPAGHRALTGGDVTIYADIAERVAAGEPWTSKRMRQRSDYLWRMLARASARATPRGWLAHVGVLTVAQQGWAAGQPLAVDDQAAAETVDNIDDTRIWSGGMVAAGHDADVSVAQSPLAWREAAHVAVWVLRGEGRTWLSRVTVRRTPALDAVWSRLSDGPRSVQTLVSGLTGGNADHAPAVRRFLAHLVSLGVLQAASAPTMIRSSWHEMSAPPLPSGSGPAGGRYTDVYRRPVRPLAETHADSLADLIGIACRVMACADTGPDAAARRLPEAVTERPRPILDVAADCINDDDPFGSWMPRHDWAVPAGRDPAYQRLHAWLTEQLPADPRQAGDPIDLDPAALDRWGVADANVHWPTDALLRPIAAGDGGPVAALITLSPAGVLDARFLPALSALGEALPQITAYQQFLDRVTELTGVRFVEVLIPPLSRQAANAVRRPAYTSWWTGDPDPSGYFDPGLPGPMRYLPLARITARHDEREVIIEFDGERIWPLIHTARVARAPWNIVRALLTSGSPQFDRQFWRPLANSLPAWPERDCLPRITVGGRLVLTPAQWHVRRDDFGQRDDRLADRARALASLRRNRRIPRWVTVSADARDDPVVLDLDSLRALRAVDRFPAEHRSFALSELIPGPGELPVRDLAEPDAAGHYAELLLRLPHRSTPDVAAAAVASRLAAAFPVSTATSESVAGPAESRHG